MLPIVEGSLTFTNWPTPRLLSTAARLADHAWDEQLASLRSASSTVVAVIFFCALVVLMESNLSLFLGRLTRQGMA